MKKAAVMTIVVLFTSTAWALTRMGPTVSSTREGQLSLGAEYSTGETDMEAESSDVGVGFPLSDVDTDMFFGRLGYGFFEGSEIFGRLGASDVGDGSEVFGRAGASELDDEGKAFAWGAGANIAFGTDAKVNWGVLFQVTGLTSDETEFPLEWDMDIYEFQVAVGPTYRMDGLCLYGGPFAHFITGDLDLNIGGPTVSFDLEQESEIGGYIGLSAEIADNTNLSVEYQYTDGADVIGIGLVHRFGESSSARTRYRGWPSGRRPTATRSNASSCRAWAAWCPG